MRMIVKLLHVTTDNEIADLFTKAVDPDTFFRLRDKMMNIRTMMVTEMARKAEKMCMKLSSIIDMFD